jgi:hypothetical protein
MALDWGLCLVPRLERDKFFQSLPLYVHERSESVFDEDFFYQVVGVHIQCPMAIVQTLSIVHSKEVDVIQL